MGSGSSLCVDPSTVLVPKYSESEKKRLEHITKNKRQDVTSVPQLSEADLQRLITTVQLEWCTQWESPPHITIHYKERDDLLVEVKRCLAQYPDGCTIKNQDQSLCVEYKQMEHNRMLRLWDIKIPVQNRRQGWAKAIIRLLHHHATHVIHAPGFVVGPIINVNLRFLLQNIQLGFIPRLYMAPLDVWSPIAQDALPF